MLCACVIPLSHSFDGFCKAHGNRLGHPQIYMMRVTESKKYKAVAFFFSCSQHAIAKPSIVRLMS